MPVLIAHAPPPRLDPSVPLARDLAEAAGIAGRLWSGGT
jgi:hypothetical protein